MRRVGSGHLAVAVDQEQDAAVDPAAVSRKLNRHLVPWLFSLGVLCYLDRTNLAFAALELNRDLGLSCSTYGLGAALFFVSYALFQIPSTVVCARLGAPLWLSVNIVAWGAVACLFAGASSVPAFLALRFLLGATESAAFPGMWYHLSLFYPPDSAPGQAGGQAQHQPGGIGLGAAYARVASCTALAQVLGAPLAAGILMMDGLGGLRGWQWLFLLEGAATVLFGAVLRLALWPSPAKARGLTHAEREWLQERQHLAATGARQQQQAAGGSGASSAAAGREGGSGWAGLVAALKKPFGVVRDWRILWLAGSWLLVAAVMFGMTFFMPLLVSAMFSGSASIAAGGAPATHRVPGCHGGGKASPSAHTDGQGRAPAPASRAPASPEDHWHSVLVALATAIPFTVAAVGMNINARLAERANERHGHAGMPLVLAGATLAATPVALSFVGPGLAFALISLAAGLCWSFHGPFFSWPAVFLSGEQAAAAFAFINSCGAVGGFLGPFLLGRLSDRADGGFAASMLLLGIFLTASGCSILIFPAPGSRAASADPAAAAKGLGTDDGAEDEDANGSTAAILRSADGLAEAGEEDEGDGSGSSDGRPAGERQHAWRRQQQRERQRGGGGGSSLGSGRGSVASERELEFQPILQAGRERGGHLE